MAGVDDMGYTNSAARAKIERLEKELEDERHDLGVICGEVSRVYDQLTFGRFSKPNTAAEHIIEAAEQRVAQQIEDAEEPLKDKIGELGAEVERLEARERELEGELGLVLEYFGQGVPYWHGTSPKDRLRAVLGGKESPLLARVVELEAAHSFREENHPWYGPCDGMGEQGGCAECLRVWEKGALKGDTDE